MPAAYKPLADAVRAGDAKALAAAIDNDGEAALHWKPLMDAAFAGRADMVRALLGAGAEPNIVAGHGARHTPLTRISQHHATIPRHAGHVETMRALLAAGADPNLRAGPLEVAPLVYAATAPNEEFMELLRPRTRIGIHLAAALLDEVRLKRMLRNPVRAREADSRGRGPLDYVAMSGLWKTLGSDRALRCAELLLEAGADLAQGEEIVEGSEVFVAAPLWRSLSAQRNYALAELLLEHGADPTPAVFAVTYSAETEGCELLDRFGANWEQRFEGRTPLMDLMYFRKPAGSIWLIERGVDVNATDLEGKTALHHAAAQGVRADYVQRLIDAGATVEPRDNAGKTPLDCAKEKKRAKLIALLGG